MREVNLPIEARTKALDFESFFRAEYRSLSQALLLLVGDAFEAEEIAQEAMTRVYERWDRVGKMDSPAGYAYRTALNLQRKRIRRLAVRAKRRFVAVQVEDLDRRPRIATTSSGARGSPGRSARGADLVDWLDMDTEEAASVLGIKPGSVRVRLHRARSSLRDALGVTP